MEKESKQTEVIEETPKEEISKETSEIVSTEEKKPSTKPRTEEEFRTIQSLKDKADARAIRAEKDFQSVQNQLQELRNDMERERLEAQKRQLDALADDPEAQRKLMAKFDLDKERREFEASMKRERKGLDEAVNQIGDLAETYNLTAKDIREILNDARSPKEMELMAKLKAAEREKEKGKVQDTKEKETEGFVPDSSRSEGSPSDFKQLEQNFIADPQKYALAYKKALAKRGQ